MALRRAALRFSIMVELTVSLVWPRNFGAFVNVAGQTPMLNAHVRPPPPPLGVVFKLVTLSLLRLTECKRTKLSTWSPMFMAPVEPLQGGVSDCVLSGVTSSGRSQWPSQQPSTTALGRRGKIVEQHEEQEEEVYETHFTLRGLKTPPPGTWLGPLGEPVPQVRLEAAVRALVIDGLPTFALPVLAGSAGEAIEVVRSPLFSSSSWRRGTRRRSRRYSTCPTQPSGCGTASRVGRSGGTGAPVPPPGIILRASGSSGSARGVSCFDLPPFLPGWWVSG